MAFWGNEFIFDGISCTQFGLEVYDFGSNGQSDVEFKVGETVEDRIPGRYDALTYGINQNQALEFTLVFGANMESIDANSSMDRYDINAIAAWLTGHREYKWLTIVQDDMDVFRYKCRISNLRPITYGSMPWAFSCTVSCDSPFAYTVPETFSYAVSGTDTVTLRNRSGYNGFYRPKMQITMNGGDSVAVQNASDNDRVFQFSGLPGGNGLVITVDNQNQVITNSQDLNLYPYFNMRFMRLVRGDNVLTITGNAAVSFICEFPVSIGG